MEIWYSLPGINDPLSSLSHWVGAICFFVLSFFLLKDASRNPSTFWFVAVFVIAIDVQLVLSSIYHMIPLETVARSIMLRVDVSVIFIVIAGTLTPLHGLLFKDWRRWGVLIPLWIVAFGALALRITFFTSIPKYAGSLIFIAMGWLGAVSFFLIARQYGWKAASFILYGGLAYTIGGLGNAIEWPLLIPYVWGPHETLHLFVLLGMGFHWNLISRIVEGKIGNEELMPTNPAIDEFSLDRQLSIEVE